MLNGRWHSGEPSLHGMSPTQRSMAKRLERPAPDEELRLGRSTPSVSATTNTCAADSTAVSRQEFGMLHINGWPRCWENGIANMRDVDSKWTRHVIAMHDSDAMLARRACCLGAVLNVQEISKILRTTARSYLDVRGNHPPHISCATTPHSTCPVLLETVKKSQAFRFLEKGSPSVRHVFWVAFQ